MLDSRMTEERREEGRIKEKLLVWILASDLCETRCDQAQMKKDEEAMRTRTQRCRIRTGEQDFRGKREGARERRRDLASSETLWGREECRNPGFEALRGWEGVSKIGQYLFHVVRQVLSKRIKIQMLHPLIGSHL